MNYPTITIVVPTYNEEKNIVACLQSIRRQNYPQKSVEIIIVDNYSIDQTTILAKNYSVKIFKNRLRHAEVSKMLGFRKAKGEFVFYLDADIQLRGKNWLKEMINPFYHDKRITGVFTRYYSNKDSSPIERYLNLDPLQRDGIYRFFSPNLDTLVEKKEPGYWLLKYSPDRILPAGLCVYRRKELMSLVGRYSMFLELDFLVLFVLKGLNVFAYVPTAGLYHRHVSSLQNLLQKRRYNLEKVYLARGKRLYKWFDLTTPAGFLKIVGWIIWSNLLIPSIIVGFVRSAKHSSWVGLYEPVINFLVTDMLVVNLLCKGGFGKVLAKPTLE